MGLPITNLTQRLVSITGIGLTVFFLASCASTATPASLSALNIEALIMPGDLPAEFNVGPISHTLPEVIESAPPATQIFQQTVTEGRLTSEGVAVLVYERESKAEDAYQVITGLLEQEAPLQALPNVGEKARYYQKFTNGYLSSYTTKIVYHRCQAVILVSLFSPKAKAEVVTAYAQKLDDRLTPLLCP
jgi:hypothetical protein